VTIRSTIFAFLALAATGCPASQREIRAAKTSGYDADFALVYTQVLAAVTELYPHLVENPSAGVIKTAWHQIKIRQGDGGGGSSGTTSGAAPNFDPDAQAGGMTGAAAAGGGSLEAGGIHPGGTLYFVRFNVYVLGGRPWRVRIEAEAAEWEAGMKQSRLTGAARPEWLKGRTEALQVAIYRKLRKFAVSLDKVNLRKRPPRKKKAVDLARYGAIPEPAAKRIHALHTALLAGKFDQVRAFLIDEFVWSAGGAPSADQAIIMWQADPTIASRLLAALDAGCGGADGGAVTCPAEPAPGGPRATFRLVGDAWMFVSFVNE